MLRDRSFREAVDVLARTLYGEGRGESIKGRIAIACVIMNRVNTDIHGDGKPDWWGEGVVEVCKKPWQFSCWNARDPNRYHLERVTAVNPVFSECLAIAEAAVEGLLVDPTGGATHYINPKHADPNWDDGKSFVEIGAHRFFSDV